MSELEQLIEAMDQKQARLSELMGADNVDQAEPEEIEIKGAADDFSYGGVVMADGQYCEIVPAEL